jgi:hypothetical protein
VLDCFQTWRREATGDNPWQSGTSVDGVVVALGLPKLNQVEKHERAEEGERVKQKGVAERPGFTGILKLRAPSNGGNRRVNSPALKCFRWGKRESKERGSRGTYGLILAGLKTRGVSGGVTSNGRCFGFQGERRFGEDGADMWVPPGSEI